MAGSTHTALASATIHKGNAHVHFTDVLGTSSRKVTVSTSNSVNAHTDKAWEIAPGASQTLFINTATTGLAPPLMPSGDGSYCNIDIYYENGASAVQTFTNQSCPASVTVTNTTTDRAGVYRMRIRFRNCTLFALGSCTTFEYAEQDSDANLGTGDASNHRGALRVGMDVSSITVSAYPAGSTFAYGVSGDETFTITANHTLPRAVSNNEDVRVNVRKTGFSKNGATQKANSGGATTQVFTVNNDFPAEAASYDAEIELMGNSVLMTGETWTHINVATSPVVKDSATIARRPSFFNIDPRISINDLVLGESLYNRGETATHQFSIRNARNEQLTRTMTWNIRDSANAVKSSKSDSGSTYGDGGAGNYTIGATDDATSDTTGAQWNIITTVADAHNIGVDIYLVSDLLRVSTLGNGTIDHNTASFSDSGYTSAASVFNRGEAVYNQFYLYGARNNLITNANANGTSLSLQVRNTSDASEGSPISVSADGDGRVRWEYSVGASHTATSDTTGSAKNFTLTKNGNTLRQGANGTVGSGNEWAVSDLLRISTVNTGNNSAGIDDNTLTFLDSGYSQSGTVFNRGETVYNQFYLYNVRGALIANASPIGTDLTLTVKNIGDSTEEAATVAVDVSDAGRVRWNYGAAAGDSATSDTAGSAKKFALTVDGNTLRKETDGTVESGPEWFLSDLLRISTLSDGTINHETETFNDAGYSVATTLFNRGETIYNQFYLYGVRGTLLSSASPIGTGLALTVRTNTTADTGQPAGTVSADGSGRVRWSYVANAADPAAQTQEGTPKNFTLTKTGNTLRQGADEEIGSGSEWNVSSLLKVENIWHAKLQSDLAESGMFFIGGDNVEVRTRILNVRDESKESATVDAEFIRPDSTVHTSWSLATASDGWTAWRTFAAAAPIGSWMLTAQTSDAFDNNSAVREETIVLGTMHDPIRLSVSPVQAKPDQIVQIVIHESSLAGIAITGNASGTFVYIYDPSNDLIVNGENPTEQNNGSYYYNYTLGSDPELGNWQVVVRAQIDEVADEYAAAINFYVELPDSVIGNFSVNDASATTTSFITTLTSSVDDFYNDTVILFLSGPNANLLRRISDYDGSTKRVTVSPALPVAPGDGDRFSLLKETAASASGGGGSTAEDIWSYETRTLTSFGTLVADIWAYSTRTLTSFGTLVADIWAYSTRSLTTFGTLVADIWNNSTRTLTGFGALAADIWNDALAPTRRLTDGQLAGGGTLATEAYVDTATSTLVAEVNENEAKIDAIYSDTQYIRGKADDLVAKWGVYTAADIIAEVDDVEERIGLSGDASSTESLFGRTKYLQEKWGVQTAETIYEKEEATRLLAADVQSELGYSGTSTTAFADIQLLKEQADEIGQYIGTPDDTATSTLFGAVKDIRTQLDNLDTIETKLDTVDAVVDAIRASQQLRYAVVLSDAGEVLQGGTYRAKLSVWDYENNPANALSTPTVVVYDASRATAVSGSMSLLSTGVYEFTYVVPTSSVSGLWETVVSVDLGGSSALTLNDYWEVEGSPAQVVINAVTDTSVPSIVADVTITNEGSADYEYQYEWCVVVSQENPCGGGDDVYYASAAKFIQEGQDFRTDLSATVPDPGEYIFKVVVYFGTEASGASRMFTAVTETIVPPDEPAGAGTGTGTGTDGGAITLSNLYYLLLDLHEEVGYHGKPTTVYEDLAQTQYRLGVLPQQLTEPLYGILTGLGADIRAMNQETSETLEGLYTLQRADALELRIILNKIEDLRAMSEMTRTLISGGFSRPVIQTWFTEGSVILNIMVTNPPDVARTVEIKEYLPKEIREEHIFEIEDGLELGYDAALDTYYVSGEVRLAAGEKKIFKVTAEDVFKISEDEISALRAQADTLMRPLIGTSYFAQASILKSEIDANLDSIVRTQDEAPSSIEKRISLYRKNQQDLQKADENTNALKALASEASGQGGIFGNLFGVSTTMTWAIILIAITGVVVLMISLATLLTRARALERHMTGEKKNVSRKASVKKRTKKRTRRRA